MTRLNRSLSDHVAGEVRAQLARQGVKGTTVARLLGLSRQQVSQRLNGRIEFRNSELEKIADLLGVPARDFFPQPERAA